MAFSPPAELFGEQGIIVLIVIAVVLFGSTQIPKLARSLGSAQKEFKKGLDEGANGEAGAAKSAAAPAAPLNEAPQAAAPAPAPAPPRLPRTAPRAPLPEHLRTVPSDVGADDAPQGRAPDAAGRWQLPFWALQVLELGVAFLLVTQSVHVSRGGLLVGGGVALFVLAVTADGPLGVVRVCGRRLHRILVMALAVVLAAGCAVAALRPDVEGLLVIGAAVVALLVLASRTTVTGGRGRRRKARRGGARSSTPPPPSRRAPDRAASDDRSDPAGRLGPAQGRAHHGRGRGRRQAGRGRAPAAGRGRRQADHPWGRAAGREAGRAPRRLPMPADRS